MKDINVPSIEALCKEVAQAVCGCARHAMRALGRMSWPALLLACVALSLLITILPLAVFLFIVFLLLKLVIGATLFNKHRRDTDQHP
ncbi:MAG TPA: hypothetical protein DCW29_03855 [Janthinobacterium sp.]|nr:hypothetical protein [Janthinobacterium sp.]